MPNNIIHLRDDLKPLCDDLRYEKHDPVKSIISNFIKDAERYEKYRYDSDDEEDTEMPNDRQHVNDMLPFEGSTDVAFKGAGDFGFFSAIYECYNHHFALKTIPDDWWYTIIRTIALAIDRNSKEEDVRKFFVNHEGKKRLTVDVDDTCGIDYERFFREMTNLIQSNIKVTGYVDAIRSNFSTSTPTHRIVSEITAMSSMQILDMRMYSEYKMRTDCGIPYVEVLGQEEDWVQLKMKFITLRNMLKPIHEVVGLKDWWDRVEVICNKLIETSNVNGDKQWWSYIFTHEQHGLVGFGSYVTYDGWFLRDLLNIPRKVESLASLPSGLVSVPLVFQHTDGTETKGAIVSGIAGIKIDKSKDIPTVESTHGWAIFQ